ncbi:hypothetical protein AC233_31685 [Burkholderia sp. HB1]|jgi:hypothetical protein|nr:hypothetical protein AC233_31685 [Burkholderia sp. HB1]
MPEETEATLSSAITQWLTEGDRRSLRLALADQQTIFAFHWVRCRCQRAHSALLISIVMGVGKTLTTG